MLMDSCEAELILFHVLSGNVFPNISDNLLSLQLFCITGLQLPCDHPKTLQFSFLLSNYWLMSPQVITKVCDHLTFIFYNSLSPGHFICPILS